MAEVARLEGRLIIDGIRESQSALRSFDSAMASTAKNAEAATDRVEKSASGLSQSLKGVGQTALGTAAGIAGFTTGQQVMTTAIEGTIGAALGYEKALNVMQATSQATDAEMKQISNTAKDLGNDNTLAGVSALDAAAAMTELSRAGLSVNDTISASKGVLQLATAGQLENAEAASITAAALNSFGLAGSEATRVADLLAAAANSSQADVRELGQGMAQASAIFHNAGQPIETLITAMAQMSNAGIKGSDAATSLKTAMLSLQAPSKDGAAVMEQYGINIRDAQGNMLPFRDIITELSAKLGGLGAAQQDAAMKTIFGSDAIRAAQIVLTAGTDAYDENAAAVGRVGAANELAAAQMKGAAGAIAVFQSQLETIGLIAGEKVLPQITTLMGGLSSLVTLFTNLPGPIQIAAAAVTALGVAFLAFSASPVIAAITAITLGVTFLAGKLSEANTAQQALNNSLQAAGASALTTYAQALKNIETAGGGLAEKQAFLRGQVSSLAVEYGRGNQALGEAIAKYNELKGAHGEASVQAEAQKKIVTDLTQSQYNLAGSLQVARGAVADGGAALQAQAQQATAAKDAINQTAQAAQNAGSAAGALDPLQQALEEVFGSADKAMKALRDLMNPPTGEEQALIGRLSAIDSAVKNLGAATQTAGGSREAFIDQSREMVNQSGLEGAALDRANQAIDQYQQGIIDGAAAQKQIEAAVKPTVDSLNAQREAMASTRQAIGSLAEAEISAARGWSDSMAQRKQAADEFVATATGRFPEVGTAAQAAGDAANTGLASIGGPEVQGVVSGSMNTIVGIIDGASGSAAGAGANFGSAFAAGIQGQVANVAAAAQALAAAAETNLGGSLGIHSPSTVGIGQGEDYGEGVAIGVENMAEMVGEAAEHLAFSLISPLDRMAPSLRENQAALARLAVEIAKLNEQLAYVEPHSEREAALKAEIATLQAWQGQIQAGISILDAEAKALEMSKTALDGAVEARSKFLMQQSDIARFGAGGAGVMGGILAALTENTGESGRDAYAGLEDFIEGLKDTLGPRAQEAGNYLRFLFFETLAATGGDREAALSRFETFFGDLQAQSQVQMTVSAQTMNSALTGALFDEATKASLGEKAAGLRTAIAQMLNVSGTPEAQQAMENVAGLVAGFEAEIRKLPASIQGPILAEYQAAMRAFADAPNDAGVIQNLERVVSEADRALAFIPKNLDKLAPEMRAAAINLWEQVKAGLISAEEASERFQQALGMIPQEMSKLGPEVRSEIQRIIDGFVAMGGSAEQAGAQIEAAMSRAAAATSKLSAEQERSLTAHQTVNQKGMADQGGIVGPAANFNEMYARSQAGLTGPQELAALARAKEMFEQFGREEQARIQADVAQKEFLRQLTVKIPAAERDEASMILADLSEGLISIDDAIRELLELLREQRRRGDQPVQTNLYVDGREIATVTAPYISREIAASVAGTAGTG